MSDVLDTKVVELKFNNKDFEKNVKTSLSTIEKLKKALNFDTVTTSIQTLNSALQLKNLSNINKEVNNLVNLVDTSVSPIMNAINTIGGAITKTIGGAISGVVSKIETGGINRAFNIEAAKFSLQGLGIEWKTVSDSINNAVSGTAYGLDQAAKATAVLSASGIGVDQVADSLGKEGDTLPELERDLKAVSGIAAQTGQDFDRIADVFSTIANNGKVMTMQVRQFSTYGLNATADLAEYYGVAISDIEDMLKKGKIASDDFFDMMYKKYWENAGKANETVTGVESNIKAALGRIGAAFVSPIVANKGPLNQFLNSYMGAINKVASKLKPLESKDDKGNLIEGKLVRYATDVVIKYMGEIQNAIDNFNILRLWRSVYRFLKGTIKLLESAINYVKAISDAFKVVFPENFLNTLLNVAKGWTDFTNGIFKASKSEKVLSMLRSTFIDIFFSVKDLFDFVSNNVQNFAEALKEMLGEWNVHPLFIFADVIRYIKEQIDKNGVSVKTFKSILSSIGKIVAHVAGIMSALGQAIAETFKEGNFHPVEYLATLLATLTDGITSNGKKTEQLKNTFKIFTTIIAVIAKVLGAIFLIVAKGINTLLKVGGALLYITSPLGIIISKIFELGTALKDIIVDKFKEFSDFLSNFSLGKFENLSGVVEGIKNAFSGAKDKLGEFANSIGDFIGKVGEFFKSILDKIDLGAAFETVVGVLDTIVGLIGDVAGAIIDKLGEAADFVIDKFKDVKDWFDDIFGNVTIGKIGDTNNKLGETKDIFEKIKKINVFGAIGKGFEKIGDFIKSIGDTKLFKAIAEDFGDFFGKMSDDIKGFANLEGDISPFEAVIGILKTLGEGLVISVASVAKGVSETWDSLAPILESDTTQKLLDIFTKLFLLFTTYKWADAADNFGKALSKFTALLNVNFKKTGKQTRWFKEFAESLLMMAAAILILGEMDTGELAQGLVAVGILAAVLTGLMIFFNKINKNTETLYGNLEGNKIDGLTGLFAKQESSVVTFTKALKGIAVAILVLSLAMKIIATMNLEETIRSLAVVVILIGVMAAVIKVLNKDPIKTEQVDMFSNMGKAIKAIGSSILIMAIAMKIIATMNLEDTIRAGIVIAAMMGMMILILRECNKIAANAKSSEKYVEAIAQVQRVLSTIAKSLILMAIAMKIIGSMNLKDTVRASIVMAGLMVGMMLILNALAKIAEGSKNSKNYITTISLAAPAILAIAQSMLLLSIALKVLASISVPSLAKGIIAIAVAIGVLVGFAVLITKSGCALALEALAASMLMIGGAAALLGLAVMEIATALLILSAIGPAGLVVISSLIVALGKALGGALMEFLDAIDPKKLIIWIIDVVNQIVLALIKCVGGWVKAVIQEVIDSLTAIDKFLDDFGIRLVKTVTKILTIVMNGLHEWMPMIVDIVITVFEGLQEVLPTIVETLLKLIRLLLQGIADNAETFIESIVAIITAILDGIVKVADIFLDKFWDLLVVIGEWLDEKCPKIVDWLAEFVGKMLAKLAMATPKAIKTFVETIIDEFKKLFGINSPSKVFMDIGKDLIQGLLDGVNALLGNVLDFFAGLVQDIIDAFVDLPGNLLNIGSNIIENLKNGIKVVAKGANGIKNFVKEKVVDAIKAAMDITKFFLNKGKALITNLKNGIESVASGIKNFVTRVVSDPIGAALDLYEAMKDIGSNIIQGLLDGIESLAGDAVEFGKDIADEVIGAVKGAFAVRSPSRVMRDIGQYVDEGLILGFKDKANNVVNTMTSLAENTVDPVRDAAMTISDLINNEMNGNPTITPVIDMSNVQAASGAISSMFNSQSIDMNANLSGISNSIRRIQNEDPNADLMDAISGLKDNINNNINTYNVNGITYDDGSNIADAVGQLINAAMIERRM